jgi:hypothetical protein
MDGSILCRFDHYLVFVVNAFEDFDLPLCTFEQAFALMEGEGKSVCKEVFLVFIKGDVEVELSVVLLSLSKNITLQILSPAQLAPIPPLPPSRRA